MGRKENKVMTMTKERYLLGQEYMSIARQLGQFDMIPERDLSNSDKQKIVLLLEREAELDIELEDYLIKDEDVEGLKIFRQNQEYNTLKLWNLKQSLANG